MTAAPSPRSRLVEWEDPAALAEAIRRDGGLSMLHQIADGSLPLAPMSKLLGIELVEAQPGRAVWSAEPSEVHLNEPGLVHGGLASSILDTTLATTVLSALPAGTRLAGLQLSVNFLRRLVPGAGRVLCEGRIVHLGRTVAVSEADLRSESGGELLARATSTFSVMREEPEGR